jgi:uncharacterized protein YijF (DUF1287 family)
MEIDMKTRLILIISAFILIAAIVIGLIFLINFYFKENSYFNSERYYTASELNIPEIKSKNDKNNNGVDDYTDIMLGARKFVESNPAYKSDYIVGGYPPEGTGVCTDVVAKGFENAGYNLKDMVDKDIAENLSKYTTIKEPDPNIDYRRVKNLKIFFDRKAQSLPTSFDNPADWQAGDIVVFTTHIAVCSDRRNKDGIPYIIHHDTGGAREANNIHDMPIVGHYRWNG